MRKGTGGPGIVSLFCSRRGPIRGPDPRFPRTGKSGGCPRFGFLNLGLGVALPLIADSLLVLPLASFFVRSLFWQKANNQAGNRIVRCVRHDSGPQILPHFRQDSEHQSIHADDHRRFCPLVNVPNAKQHRR